MTDMNKSITQFDNIVKKVAKSFDLKLQPVDLFLLLCTCPNGNGTFITLNSSSLTIIRTDIHNSSNDFHLSITKQEEIHYWVYNLLTLFSKTDPYYNKEQIEDNDYRFDYILNWKGQNIKYNIQHKIETTNDSPRSQLSHFSVIFRIIAPENFEIFPLSPNGIIAYNIEKQLEELNIHNKDITKKGKL